MVPLCLRPRQRPSLVLGAEAVGLGWGAIVAALSSGTTVSRLFKSCAMEGFAWTKALITLSMSCSEGTEPEGPESESRCYKPWVRLPG